MKDWVKPIIGALSLLVFILAMTHSCDRLIRHHFPNDTITIERVEYRHDTIIKVDTIKYEIPKLVYKERIKTVYIEDSVDVEQKVYFDSTYTAFVSGIDAELDSIHIYPRITFIRDSITIFRDNYIKTPTKKKRWNVGLQGGYGITKDGLSPYIGIGIGYTLF